jgi:hypothetical protein
MTKTTSSASSSSNTLLIGPAKINVGGVGSSTLKDAEMISFKNIKNTLFKENNILTLQLNQLQQSLFSTEEKCNKAIALFEEKLRTMQETNSNNNILSIVPPSLLATPFDGCNRTRSFLAITEGETIPPPPPSTSGKLAKKYLVGTPGAKSLSVMTEEIMTEQKNHRFSPEEKEIQSLLMKLKETSNELAEAMIVIKEQDRIIHEGKRSLPFLSPF